MDPFALLFTIYTYIYIYNIYICMYIYIYIFKIKVLKLRGRLDTRRSGLRSALQVLHRPRLVLLKRGHGPKNQGNPEERKNGKKATRMAGMAIQSHAASVGSGASEPSEPCEPTVINGAEAGAGGEAFCMDRILRRKPQRQNPFSGFEANKASISGAWRG